MDGYNHLEHLISKGTYKKVIYLPIQNSKNNACTHIAFEAARRGCDLVNSYFESNKNFTDIYKQIIENGEENRKIYGVYGEGDDPNEEQIKLSYPDICESIEKFGGYKSSIYVNGICVDLEHFNKGLNELTKPGKFMIIRRDEATFLLLSISRQKESEHGEHLLVIDTHFPCSGVLSFDNTRDYILQNGHYSGEYLFGVGSFQELVKENINKIVEQIKENTNAKQNSEQIMENKQEITVENEESNNKINIKSLVSNFIDDVEDAVKSDEFQEQLVKELQKNEDSPKEFIENFVDVLMGDAKKIQEQLEKNEEQNNKTQKPENNDLLKNDFIEKINDMLKNVNSHDIEPTIELKEKKMEKQLNQKEQSNDQEMNKIANEKVVNSLFNFFNNSINKHSNEKKIQEKQKIAKTQEELDLEMALSIQEQINQEEGMHGSKMPKFSMNQEDSILISKLNKYMGKTNQTNDINENKNKHGNSDITDFDLIQVLEKSSKEFDEMDNTIII